MKDRDSKFWSSEPVGTGKDNEGIIVRPQFIDLNAIKLPHGYSWGDVSNSEEVHLFLDENYGEYSTENGWGISYSIETIQKYVNFQKIFKIYSIGIFMNNQLIGYIYGRVHNVNYEGKIEKCIGVNFLCIIPTHRNKGLAPYLIKELTRRAYKDGVYKGIFLGDTNKGFSFTEIYYHHAVLNDKNLPNFISSLEGEDHSSYTIRKDTLIDFKNSRGCYESIYKLYTENCKNFEMYEELTLEEFIYIMSPVKDCNYTLYNSNTNEFASFFIIYNIDRNTGLKIKKAFLYYWSGELEIIKDSMALALSLNCGMFDVLNLGENEDKIISPLKLHVGSGHLYFHLYNWKISKTSKYKTNFLLL